MKYQDILKEYLSRRISMNPRYSLRAFANALGLEPSKLSEVLSGKKGLSADRAEKVCEKLRLQGLDRDIFILSVLSQRSKGNWSSVRKTEASLETRRTEGICFYVSLFFIPLLKGLFVCPFTNIYCKETGCLCQRRKPSKQMANLI